MSNVTNGDQSITPQPTIDIYKALFSRRSPGGFTDDPVNADALTRMLNAAIWAPNHRLTEPWRFFVITQDSRRKQEIADLAAETAWEQSTNPNPEQKQRAADTNRQRILEAPALIYAYCTAGRNEEEARENYAAVSCALQNLSLAALAEGFGVQWSTGNVAKHPKLAETLGADQDWSLVAALFVGKPSKTPTSRRTEASAFTTWI
ncbi:MAG: nitroreductase [Chloroflexota bacterium]|nr:nitroreductase [Chloroflexota bacterium]